MTARLGLDGLDGLVDVVVDRAESVLELDVDDARDELAELRGRRFDPVTAHSDCWCRT